MTEIKKRTNPILGVSCPVCGSVFSVQAFQAEYFNENDHEENARTLKELIDYAMQGLDIKVYERDGYTFHLCDHVKNRTK